jgi:predicted  nucleic acid-binding Zn-ribbon protein
MTNQEGRGSGTRETMNAEQFIENYTKVMTALTREIRANRLREARLLSRAIEAETRLETLSKEYDNAVDRIVELLREIAELKQREGWARN